MKETSWYKALENWAEGQAFLNFVFCSFGFGFWFQQNRSDDTQKVIIPSQDPATVLWKAKEHDNIMCLLVELSLQTIPAQAPVTCLRKPTSDSCPQSLESPSAMGVLPDEAPCTVGQRKAVPAMACPSSCPTEAGSLIKMVAHYILHSEGSILRPVNS